MRTHRHGRIAREHILPWKVVRTGVQQIGIAGIDATDDEHDARRKPRPQASAKSFALPTEKRGAPSEGTHALDSK